MAWPWLSILAKNVPWGELVRRTPDIIAASRKLLEKNKWRDEWPIDKNREESNSDQLSKRIAILEEHDEEHAEIIAQMVDQMEGLTNGLEVLAARNRLLLWVVAVLTSAFVVALLVFNG